MKNDDLNSKKAHPFLYETLFRMAGVLTLLTLITACLVCGMLARYASMDSNFDSANVAAAGQVSIYEHKAVYQNGEYFLDRSVEVTENSYGVVPGITIPKDSFIRLSGTNDVSCRLYVEIVPSDDWVSYSVDETAWEEANTELAPYHGGQVYKYKTEISPHRSGEISGLFEGTSIYITDELRDKTQAADHATPLTVKVYAYLIQID